MNQSRKILEAVTERGQGRLALHSSCISWCVLALSLTCFPLGMLTPQANAATFDSNSNVLTNSWIPWDEIAARATAQYSGDGLVVAADGNGAAWLRCVFQRLDGEATEEGRWLISTASGAATDRFRIVASSVGRTPRKRSADGLVRGNREQQRAAQPSALRAVPHVGRVEVSDDVVRFVRSDVIEEYSVSTDGVRQDFVILKRPEGDGELRVVKGSVLGSVLDIDI